MRTLLKQVLIKDVKSSFNNQIKDILIVDGKIDLIEDSINAEADQTFDSENTIVSPAFIDGLCWVGEPGFEHIETFVSLNQKALKGGYSDVILASDTFPVRQSASEIKNVLHQNKIFETKFHPLGAISKDNKGQDISEMFDMKKAGAIGFTDNKSFIDNADLLKRAIMYADPLNLPVVVYSSNKTLSKGGQLHEGEISTKLGLKGNPSTAEEIEVYRNIALSKYCESPIHLSCISTSKSVELIKKAKAEGIEVTCDVAVANLCFTDNELEGFDTTYKVEPPLRSEDDRKALIEGILDGTIDAIVSNHKPIDIEDKVIEFEHALPGIDILENAFSLLVSKCPEIPIDKLYQFLCYSNATTFNLNVSSIEKGSEVRLTLSSLEKRANNNLNGFGLGYSHYCTEGKIITII